MASFARKHVGHVLLLGLLLGVAPAWAQTRIETEAAKLLASGRVGHDAFGDAVAVAGGTAVIGAPYNDDYGPQSGAAYVFVRSGTTWTQQAKLLASDGATGDFFGRSVAVAGDAAVVGGSGLAYVFHGLRQP